MKAIKNYKERKKDMQQQGIRTSLEAIFIKSFINHTLQQKELESFNHIVKEFSDTAKKAYAMLEEMLESKTYNENLFFNKIVTLQDSNFIKEYTEASKVANLAPLIKEYEYCVQLDRQEELASYIFSQVQQRQVIQLDTNLLKPYQYQAKADDFLSFADAEKSLKEYDPQQRYSTGVEFLDTAFNGGLATGQLILISGDYEAGKTTLTTQMLENMSAKEMVCFFCFEFTLSAYIRRRKEYPNPLLKKENLITITDGYDIREIKDKIIYLNNAKGIKVFLIDSQMRIENNNTKVGNGEEKETEKFEILGKLAHEKELIILLIVQTSKSDPDTPFKSKKGAHEASIIMHLENVENKDNSLTSYAIKRLKVKKNKQTGKHFKEEIFLNFKTQMFEKDPKHIYKDKDYNAKDSVMGATVIDLSELPMF